MNVVSPLKISHEISPAAFAQFLALLTPESEQAGEAYEELRQMMTKFFECRGVVFADDLTDEVFNRVIRRISEGEELTNIPGYCFSIARFMLLEHSRAPEHKRIDFESLPELKAPSHIEQGDDKRIHCLRQCLQTIPADQRALVLEYYQDERRVKIDARQAMADRLGISRNALATRVVRLRNKLERCIIRCLKK